MIIALHVLGDVENVGWESHHQAILLWGVAQKAVDINGT
jgi:hypothetical protein